MCLIFAAVFNESNYAMILANRSVILCKIKECEWAIRDLNLAIETGKYPKENIYKLHQRKAKAHEFLANFDSAIQDYNNVIQAVEFSTLTKPQKLQIRKESEKYSALCKKKSVAKNFVSVDEDENDKSKLEFPRYHSMHPDIQNASGIWMCKFKHMGSSYEFTTTYFTYFSNDFIFTT